MLKVLVMMACVTISAAGNHYCNNIVAPGAVIHRFEGKFNVPAKPAEEPDKVLFLWPAAVSIVAGCKQQQGFAAVNGYVADMGG